MPSDQNASGSAAHKPTSLDFINLPNPIEPDSHGGSQKHPLNGDPRLEKAPGRDFFSGLFHEPTNVIAERPAKRPKPTDNPLELDLPKLPVKNAVKRQRLPPTLSGLHHPPPNAGILPSINVEKPQTPPRRTAQPVTQSAVVPLPASSASKASEAASAKDVTLPDTFPCDKSTTAQQKRTTKRNKWTAEETESLLKGALRFGVGNWTKILKCDDYKFTNRTALDLKDRFRVVCPNYYKNRKQSKAKSSSHENDSDSGSRPASTTRHTKGPPPEKISPSTLKKMGISEPFTQTSRRSRHPYTEAEDQDLLKGFKRYGKSWSLIQQDETLCLSNRTATDLRDRLRTKFPEEYAGAGLTLRKDKGNASKRPVDENSDPETGPNKEPETSVKKGPAPKTAIGESVTTLLNRDEDTQIKSTTTRKPSLFSLDDVFLGNLYGVDDDVDPEPITLDRGILDWAGADNARTANIQDASKNSGIDPLMTLKLPKPIASLPTPAPGFSHSLPADNTVSLPSLSNLLPDQAYSEQLELPSLNQWLN